MIQTEEEAEDAVRTIVNDLLSGSRPLNEMQYTLVLTFIRDHIESILDIVSKNTCVRLLIDTKNLSLADSLNLSDVMKRSSYGMDFYITFIINPKMKRRKYLYMP